VYGGDLERVLSRHGGDRATAENAERMERLEVGLDAGSAPLSLPAIVRATGGGLSMESTH